MTLLTADVLRARIQRIMDPGHWKLDVDSNRAPQRLTFDRLVRFEGMVDGMGGLSVDLVGRCAWSRRS